MQQLSFSSFLLVLFSFFIFLNASNPAIATASDDLVSTAWKAFDTNNFAGAEQKFKNAIDAAPNNSRAYMGLSLLYELQQRYAESWEMFRMALRFEKNPAPFWFSQWTTLKIDRNKRNPKTGIIDSLEHYAKLGEASGILQPMAHEVLGDIYQRRGQFEKAREHYAQQNAIENWIICGPFENISAAGFNTVYLPEREFEPQRIYEGKNAVPVKWYVPPVIKPDKWLDFQAYFSDRQALFYANSFVYSPIKQSAIIRVGTSGSLKVFLNDAEVLRDSLEQNNDLDTYLAATELQQGWNRLLVKVGYSELDRCNFMARITDDKGSPLQNIKFSTEPQKYSKELQNKARFIENFSEAYFKRQIELFPEQYENYFLLADAYLRNDKAVEAELTMRKAQKLLPNCGLVYHYLLQAYSRGRKRDEAATTYEKMYSLSKDLTDGIQYKFNQYLDNEDFDRAEEELLRLEKLLPGSEDAYSMRIDFYSKKKLTEKVIQTASEAYSSFPTVWRFANLAATIDYQKTRKRDGAIEIYRKFLAENYDEGVMSNLAATYLDDSKVKEWEQTYRKMLQTSPASPGYYYQISKVYGQLQKYDSSANNAQKALSFCPSCSVYWSKLGEAYRSGKRIEQAKDAYKNALVYNATDYDSRQVLRELEGKPSVFTLFKQNNIDSLVKNAPAADAYPESAASLVLESSNRVVYERGASETSQETLIRVFNDRGIDLFKEYSIPYNSYAQTMIIEKAVTIKPDGTEIRADISRNQCVFKSLAKNDFIYLKWRIRNFNSGKLGQHFWDSYYFNRFMPTLNTRYSLLIPQDMNFTYKGQNDAPEPEVRNADGTNKMYEWTSKNEAALGYEADMPNLDEVGKILRISSIPNWKYLVDWYKEVALTKTQSSYEIKEKVDELFSSKVNATTEDKIRTIYDYITENIRYSMVSFRQSALVPQKARDVLVNRIGDCKDVSTLGIAMLNEVGVKANFVLVNSGNEERIGDIPPSIAFNHCIVQAETKSGPIYLDFTANNFPAATVPGADRDAFSLVINDNSANPITLPKNQIAPPAISVRAKMTLFDDNRALIENSTTTVGNPTALLRVRYRGKPQKDRDKILQSLLSSEFPNVRLINFVIGPLDDLAPSVTFSYVCEAPNYLTDAGDYKLVKIPWQNPLRADDALSYEKRSYPIKNISSVDTVSEEIEIILPNGYTPVDLPAPSRISSGAGDYSLEFSLKGNTLKAKRRYVYMSSYVSVDEYERYKKFYNRIVKDDSRQILLKKSDN